MGKIMTYCQWMADMERSYDLMPEWYNYTSDRKAAYKRYVTSAKAWRKAHRWEWLKSFIGKWRTK